MPKQQAQAKKGKKKRKQAVVRYGKAATKVIVGVIMKGGNESAAARALGIRKETLSRWKKKHPELAAAIEDARDTYTEMLEMVAFKRGVIGVTEPVYYQGRIVGYVRKYSDMLLKTLLEGNNHKKFATRRSEITGKDGKPIGIATTPLQETTEFVAQVFSEEGEGAHEEPVQE